MFFAYSLITVLDSFSHLTCTCRHIDDSTVQNEALGNLSKLESLEVTDRLGSS
jgi:hypothetical protein